MVRYRKKYRQKVGLGASGDNSSEGRSAGGVVPGRSGLSEELPEDEESGSRSYLTELVNPVIVEKDGKICFEEGCLSVPSLTVDIDRYERVVIEALDRNGEALRFEARGFYAVVFQHEMDHLDGKTLVDRLSTLKRSLYLKKLKKTRKNGAGSRDDASPSAP